MATKTWIGSSGSEEPTAGDQLQGTTSGATATFVSATLASGTWVGGDAAGVLTLRAVSGTFGEDDVLINNRTLTTDIATIDIAGTAYTDNSGDFDIAANWSPSGIPADGDDLVFNGLTDTVPSSWAGSTKQTSGKSFSVLDGFDQSTKNFPTIIVSADYSGDIGYGQDGSTYYGLRTSADRVSFDGSGNLHLIAQHASDAIDAVASSSSSGSVFLGKGFSNGQKIAEVINSGSGSIEILGASLSTLASPEVDSVTCTGNRGDITIAEDNSSTVLVIRSVLGSVTAYCDIATASISGGTLNWGREDFTPSSAKEIDLLELLQGTVTWDMSGTVSECYAYSGTMSLSGSGTKVIGDSTLNNGTIEIYEATVDFSDAAGNITLGTDAEITILGGGQFNPPPYSDVTWTF
jgi:hypothetical protein